MQFKTTTKSQKIDKILRKDIDTNSGTLMGPHLDIQRWLESFNVERLLRQYVQFTTLFYNGEAIYDIISVTTTIALEQMIQNSTLRGCGWCAVLPYSLKKLTLGLPIILGVLIARTLKFVHDVFFKQRRDFSF